MEGRREVVPDPQPLVERLPHLGGEVGSPVRHQLLRAAVAADPLVEDCVPHSLRVLVRQGDDLGVLRPAVRDDEQVGLAGLGGLDRAKQVGMDSDPGGVRDGERLVIIASKGGAPTNPDWYHNVLANPLVSVETGTEKFQARATVAEEPERTRLYNKMVEVMPGFADYQEKTTRVIPVIILSREE